MQSFARVARASSFTTAASQLGLSRALISRHIAELEARLGVRLLNRSTRSISLTEEGGAYLDYCERLLADIETAERSIMAGRNKPSGTIKILAPKSFGSLVLADAVIDFARIQPRLRVSLVLNDFSFRPYDFIEGGFDLGIRIAVAIRDSSLLARQLATLEWILCAAPSYLDREGPPRSVDELRTRPCLAHVNVEPNDRLWRFRGPRGATSVKIDGPLLSNSALVLRRATLAGLGIALLPHYCIHQDLAAGTLVRLLPSFKVPRRPLLAVHPRSPHMPQKVRLFVDFLVNWFRRSFHPGSAHRM
jgi:DNA-binding transcriptional LysR family regulator